MMTKKRLISGIQPTGQMHLGNYLGAIANWIDLQSTYDAIFLIVDLHSLTTLYDHPSDILTHKQNLAIDLLALGVNPNSACLAMQSDISEHYELHLILSMLTPLSWLERVPTYKDKIKQVSHTDLSTYGFLGYPVLMAADILLYQGDVVPVGQDQVAHIELTREIARRFNHLYKSDVFKLPNELLTENSLIKGLDGRKMSKSYNNVIPLNCTETELIQLVKSMVTDPNRIRKTDPGNPDTCPVFSYHQIYNNSETVSEISDACRSATIGCVDCKQKCSQLMNNSLSKFRQKRAYYASNISEVTDIVHAGTNVAKRIASDTLSRVKDCLKL